MVNSENFSSSLASTHCRFSICTIISDAKEYAAMKQSFEACGFSKDCEYTIADNSEGNQYDAYQAIARFISQAAGKYLIIVHQDVRCIDNKIVLEKCLDELTTIDSKWAVCGNAGAIGYHQLVYHLDNTGKILKNENLPARVSSLDENLLIINNEKHVSVSSGLKGFHLYGTDLCINAGLSGYTCYVIPFMVKHLSTGNLEDLKVYKKYFIKTYSKKIRSRYVETTCTKFYLGDSDFKNWFFNSPVIFFLVKTWQRIKLICKRLTVPDPHRKIIT